eukprot:1190805-Prorocentrum_minimum.AAC.3
MLVGVVLIDGTPTGWIPRAHESEAPASSHRSSRMRMRMRNRKARTCDVQTNAQPAFSMVRTSSSAILLFAEFLVASVVLCGHLARRSGAFDRV